MELSINTIALFVIALSVLGLGLSLITGVLGVGGDYFSQALEGYTIEIAATNYQPLVVANPLRLHDVESNVVLVSYYNVGNDRCDDDNLQIGAFLTLECSDMSFTRFQTVPLDIPVGSAKTIGLVVDRSPDAAYGSHTCTINVYCDQRDEVTNPEGFVTADATPVYKQSIFVEVS